MAVKPVTPGGPCAWPSYLSQAEGALLDRLQSTHGTLGFIKDADGDGVESAADLFERAERRLNSLVSLGVIAGLLAGTSLSTLTVDLSSAALGPWSFACSLVSCAASVAVSTLVAYQCTQFMASLLSALGLLPYPPTPPAAPATPLHFPLPRSPPAPCRL